MLHAMSQELAQKKFAVCTELCFSKCIKYNFITVQPSWKAKFAYAIRFFVKFFINTVKCSARKVFLTRSMMRCFSLVYRGIMIRLLKKWTVGWEAKLLGQRDKYSATFYRDCKEHYLTFFFTLLFSHIKIQTSFL